MNKDKFMANERNKGVAKRILMVEGALIRALES